MNRREFLGLCLSSTALAAVGGCAATSTSLTQTQLDARTVARELVLATAAVNIAYGVYQASGLSAAVLADIKAGAAAVAAGIEQQIKVLQSGGSVASQVVGAISGALGSAVPALGGILKAAHGSTATAEIIAMAAGLAAFAQVPSISILIIDELDASWVPSDTQLAADANALTAAVAQFTATSSSMSKPLFFEGLEG